LTSGPAVRVRCSKMRVSSDIRMKKFGAAALSAFLLLSLGSGLIALASPSSDVCTMSCCVKAGRCCCAARHARVANPPSDGKATVQQPSLTAPCPEGCTSFQRNSRLSTTSLAEGARTSLDPSRSHPIHLATPRPLFSANPASSDSRAPPA